jgi:hypothetical protein
MESSRGINHFHNAARKGLEQRSRNPKQASSKDAKEIQNDRGLPDKPLTIALP